MKEISIISVLLIMLIFCGYLIHEGHWIIGSILGCLICSGVKSS